MLQNVQAACASRRPASSDTTVTSGHGRHETRTADVFSASRAMAGTEWQSLIKTLVRVTRRVLHRDAKSGLWSSTAEVAYYVANSPASACRAAAAVRCHWRVENTLHYTRDVTFQEDHSPNRQAQAGRLCQATLLRLQHTASQSVLNIQSGSICCCSRRSQCAPQVESQLRALNSPCSNPEVVPTCAKLVVTQDETLPGVTLSWYPPPPENRLNEPAATLRVPAYRIFMSPDHLIARTRASGHSSRSRPCCWETVSTVLTRQRTARIDSSNVGVKRNDVPR